MAFLRDIRHGFRTLRRVPGLTAVAGLTLALGIGANTAIFSVIYAVLLKPLVFPEADRLVQVRMAFPERNLQQTSCRTPISGTRATWRMRSRTSGRSRSAA